MALNPDVAAAVPYLRKTDMQLASKMRFISAQLIALLTDDLWLRNASHANAMAQRLEAGARAIDQVTVTRRAEANAVFAILPPAVAERLMERFHFTPGTRRLAKSAGCAPGTPPKRMWTPSWRPSARSWPSRPAGLVRSRAVH